MRIPGRDKDVPCISLRDELQELAERRLIDVVEDKEPVLPLAQPGTNKASR